jgi:hypothetical protein
MKTKKERIEHLTKKVKEGIKAKKEATAYFKSGGQVKNFKPAHNVVRPF